MLGMPESTAYDLRFRLLGIPVRVHPLFWLVMALLSGASNDIGYLLTFIGCAFVSILVHEFGHGLTSRAFGEEPSSIVLYSMGGLCQSRTERMSYGQQIAVLAAGPGAGFALVALVLLFCRAVYGLSPLDLLSPLISPLVPGFGDPGAVGLAFRGNLALLRIIYVLIFINVMWGILNLFPIWPLDGGQISMALLSLYDRRKARRWAHIVSFLVASLLALWSIRENSIFRAVFFGYFALVNYQSLQAIHDYAKYGDPYGGGGDWWKS